MHAETRSKKKNHNFSAFFVYLHWQNQPMVFAEPWTAVCHVWCKSSSVLASKPHNTNKSTLYLYIYMFVTLITLSIYFKEIRSAPKQCCYFFLAEGTSFCNEKLSWLSLPIDWCKICWGAQRSEVFHRYIISFPKSTGTVGQQLLAWKEGIPMCKKVRNQCQWCVQKSEQTCKQTNQNKQKQLTKFKKTHKKQTNTQTKQTKQNKTNQPKPTNQPQLKSSRFESYPPGNLYIHSHFTFENNFAFP